MPSFVPYFTLPYLTLPYLTLPSLLLPYLYLYLTLPCQEAARERVLLERMQLINDEGDANGSSCGEMSLRSGYGFGR
jgi:hypothetical protein